MRRQFVTLLIAYNGPPDPKDWDWSALTGAQVEVTASSDPIGICPTCGR